MNTSAEHLAQRLASALGPEALDSASLRLSSFEIDGLLPALVCVPPTPDQLAAALRICNEAAAAVAPWGGGTAVRLGNRPRAYDVALVTTKLDKVIDHDAANLTATVQCGIPLASLQTVLARKHQGASFDPPFAEKSTIGGIVAASLNGPRRSFLGSVRDLVIGMKVALPTGEQIKVGGKVVKNVAGYDMCKLFTGSLGTLGIITEVTLRMAALTESNAAVSLCSNLTATLVFIDKLARSALLPAAVLLSRGVRPQTAADDWNVTVLCEGFTETTARQIEILRSLAAETGMVHEVMPEPARMQRWQAICDLPLCAGELVCRITLPHTGLAPLLHTIEQPGSSQSGQVILADAAAGVIWLGLPDPDLAKQQFLSLIGLAKTHGGHAVMFAAPAEFKSGIDIWGASPPSLSLMREIKRQFDPHGIMNPGRFIGGI